MSPVAALICISLFKSAAQKNSIWRNKLLKCGNSRLSADQSQLSQTEFFTAKEAIAGNADGGFGFYLIMRAVRRDKIFSRAALCWQSSQNTIIVERMHVLHWRLARIDEYINWSRRFEIVVCRAQSRRAIEHLPALRSAATSGGRRKNYRGFMPVPWTVSLRGGQW